MSKDEFKRFMEIHPDAVTICKVCEKRLGQELIENGLTIHPRHSRVVGRSKKNPSAIHAASSYGMAHKYSWS